MSLSYFKRTFLSKTGTPESDSDEGDYKQNNSSIKRCRLQDSFEDNRSSKKLKTNHEWSSMVNCESELEQQEISFKKICHDINLNISLNIKNSSQDKQSNLIDCGDVNGSKSLISKSLSQNDNQIDQFVRPWIDNKKTEPINSNQWPAYNFNQPFSPSDVLNNNHHHVSKSSIKSNLDLDQSIKTYEEKIMNDLFEILSRQDAQSEIDDYVYQQRKFVPNEEKIKFKMLNEVDFPQSNHTFFEENDPIEEGELLSDDEISVGSEIQNPFSVPSVDFDNKTIIDQYSDKTKDDAICALMCMTYDDEEENEKFDTMQIDSDADLMKKKERFSPIFPSRSADQMSIDKIKNDENHQNECKFVQKQSNLATNRGPTSSNGFQDFADKYSGLFSKSTDRMDVSEPLAATHPIHYVLPTLNAFLQQQQQELEIDNALKDLRTIFNYNNLICESQSTFSSYPNNYEAPFSISSSNDTTNNLSSFSIVPNSNHASDHFNNFSSQSNLSSTTSDLNHSVKQNDSGYSSDRSSFGNLATNTFDQNNQKSKKKYDASLDIKLLNAKAKKRHSSTAKISIEQSAFKNSNQDQLSESDEKVDLLKDFFAPETGLTNKKKNKIKNQKNGDIKCTEPIKSPVKSIDFDINYCDVLATQIKLDVIRNCFNFEWFNEIINGCFVRILSTNRNASGFELVFVVDLIEKEFYDFGKQRTNKHIKIMRPDKTHEIIKMTKVSNCIVSESEFAAWYETSKASNNLIFDKSHLFEKSEDIVSLTRLNQKLVEKQEEDRRKIEKEQIKREQMKRAEQEKKESQEIQQHKSNKESIEASSEKPHDKEVVHKVVNTLVTSINDDRIIEKYDIISQSKIAKLGRIPKISQK